MKRALPIGNAILRRDRHSKGSGSTAKAAFASVILASAAAASAATITPIVYLDFANPSIGTYGAVANQTGSQLTAGTSSATYSETDATLGTGSDAYEFNGSAATFANNSMSLTGGTGLPSPGLSVAPLGTNASTASSLYTMANNIVMEAEVTSAGSQGTGSDEIIQWEADTGAQGTFPGFPRLDLLLNSGVLQGLAFASSGPNLSTPVSSNITLTPGVETHVALVYNYNGGAETLTIYTINDGTGFVTASAIGTGTTGATSTAFPTQIGILNSPEAAGNAPGNDSGRGPFNGSANDIFVGTFTGTFIPSDASVGGNFTLVPEPASLGILGAAGSMALLRRRRWTDRPRASTV